MSDADGEPPEDDDRGLELVDAQLDEQERRAPDRREQEQEAEVAAATSPATLARVAAVGRRRGDAEARG